RAGGRRSATGQRESASSYRKVRCDRWWRASKSATGSSSAFSVVGEVVECFADLATGAAERNPSLGPSARTRSMTFTPVGAGQIDFEAVFANASPAGLKHFAIEHDNAAAWGD